jgi:hypothetical protein
MNGCLLLMLWTAPAPRHRSAVDWLSQPERFKEVRQATTVAFEGIGEDRRVNADKVDPGIGRTRMGQRIFECVLSIGTRSAQSIRASGTSAASTGRTRDRTRPMLHRRQKVLAKAPSTRDPKRTLAVRLLRCTQCHGAWHDHDLSNRICPVIGRRGAG